MKKLLLTVGLMSFSISTFAALNQWTVSKAGENIKYSISNGQSQEVAIICMPNDDNYRDIHEGEDGAWFIYASRKAITALTFKINKRKFDLRIPIFLEDGREEWNKFIHQISTAKSFEVYNGSFKLGTFELKQANSELIRKRFLNCKY